MFDFFFTHFITLFKNKEKEKRLIGILTNIKRNTFITLLEEKKQEFSLVTFNDVLDVSILVLFFGYGLINYEKKREKVYFFPFDEKVDMNRLDDDFFQLFLLCCFKHILQ